jgi:hypothetical protein
MKTNSAALIDRLEHVYTALQKLNTALAVADAKLIFDSVEEINRLTRGIEDVGTNELDAENSARLLTLLERIRSIQGMNQALCNGGLRTLLWCAEVVGRAVPYDTNGRVEATVAVMGDNYYISA